MLAFVILLLWVNPVINSDVFSSMYQMEKLQEYELEIQDKIESQLKEIDVQLKNIENFINTLYKVSMKLEVRIFY